MTAQSGIRLLNQPGRTEHIALVEAAIDPSKTPKRPHRIARNHYRLKSRLHRAHTELALLEGHYLRVETGRTGKYEIDLCYANPRPERVRRIAWVWLVILVGCLAVAAGAFSLWFDGELSTTPVVVGTVAAIASTIALFQFLRRTTESLVFRSEHGKAALVAVTAGLGAVRKGKPFFVELIKSIHAAKRERTYSRKDFLCGEMREHHRLLELGVLTDREYQQSKTRILAEH